MYDSKHPEREEYAKAYGRLKMRKSRKKIDVDTFNRLVNEALNIKDRAERGELSDEEMRRLFEAI